MSILTFPSALLPLLIVRIYKVQWWTDFKIILCGKENVTHFLSTNTNKYTLFNLAQIEAPPKQPSSLAPPILAKMETSSSTKGSSHSNGLTQQQKDLLEALKDEPTLRKAYL